VNIVEIRKVAERVLSEDLPQKEYVKQCLVIQEAKGLVMVYVKYKPVLKAEVKIRAWFKKHKNAFSIICIHGDLKNVCVCQVEKNVRDLTGKIVDEGDVDETEMYCSEHDYSVVSIDEFCKETERIDEFVSLRKFLKKYE
jgi:hypothetical protein